MAIEEGFFKIPIGLENKSLKWVVTVFINNVPHLYLRKLE
jgi:hypothetical protein